MVRLKLSHVAQSPDHHTLNPVATETRKYCYYLRMKFTQIISSPDSPVDSRYSFTYNENKYNFSYKLNP